MTNDLCSPSSHDLLSLSFNGATTSLVLGSDGTYHAEADGGARIKTIAGAGALEYWELTEPDGTSYFFGRNELPGWATGDPVTNSLWTVPVSNGAGGFQNSAWRWNLDYVVDVHGNAIAYFYNNQTNYYAEDNGTTGTGQYVQGGTLAKIEYGLRDGQAYGATPAAQVNFTVGTSRQDAPDDLSCTARMPCSVTSPTFWSDDVLTGITTQSLVGSSLQDVDSWALAGTYPATGDQTTSPSLWLSSITRTGHDGTTPVASPATSFAGAPMPNRVLTAADTAAGYSLITRYRLNSITNETGGVTTVSYSGQDAACAAGNFPAPSTNTANCYPSYWVPPGGSVSRRSRTGSTCTRSARSPRRTPRAAIHRS